MVGCEYLAMEYGSLICGALDLQKHLWPLKLPLKPHVFWETLRFPTKQHPLKDNDCDDDFCKAVAAPRRKTVVANMSEQFFMGTDPFEAKPVFVVYDPERDTSDDAECACVGSIAIDLLL